MHLLSGASPRREGGANPRDVLAPLAPLIRALAASPIASRFFTFSSLSSLCFSASSHYPWVGERLPSVWPNRDGTFAIDGEPYDLAGAVALIEERLAGCPITPFFGSAPHHELPAIVAAFARAGSPLVPTLYQRAQWAHVSVAAGARRCDLTAQSAACHEGTSDWTACCESLDDTIAIARRFLEHGATLAELATDPRVTRHY